MSLIEKIDAEIARLRERSLEMDPGSESRLICRVKIDELHKIKSLVLSEQKESCYSTDDCEMKQDGKCYLDGPCPHLQKPLTIGDNIRENNESLAEFIKHYDVQIIDDCYCRRLCEHRIDGHCNIEECDRSNYNGILEYLNQPSTDTT